MELPATVSVQQVIPVLDALKALNIDAARVLRRAELDPDLLRDKLARITLRTENAVWSAAIEESGDPAIGLRIAKLLSAGALGSFGYLLGHSETLGKMIERAQRFGRIMDDLSETSLHIADEEVFVRVGRTGGYPIPPPAAECLFSVALATARHAWPHAHPLAIHFTHQCRAPLEVYRDHFGCPVLFGAKAMQIVFAARFLREVSSTVDPQLGQVLEEHASYVLTQLPASDDLVSQASHALLQLIGQGGVEPSMLARKLSVSERTLRRKLKAKKTSYHRLLDDVRRGLALKYVQDATLSLDQVAERLRFLDTSTFYRAFRRWTGTTPAQYRVLSQERTKSS